MTNSFSKIAEEIDDEGTHTLKVFLKVFIDGKPPSSENYIMNYDVESNEDLLEWVKAVEEYVKIRKRMEYRRGFCMAVNVNVQDNTKWTPVKTRMVIFADSELGPVNPIDEKHMTEYVNGIMKPVYDIEEDKYLSRTTRRLAGKQKSNIVKWL